MLRRALRSSCLTRQRFRDVPTEFENRFLCLLRISLCVVNELTSKRFYAILKAEKAFCAVTCGLRAWQKNGRISLLTTPLTTYGSGLPGFSAAKSTRKQSTRTKKPRKARKITQKIRYLAFGNWPKQVQLLSSRPKISRK